MNLHNYSAVMSVCGSWCLFFFRACVSHQVVCVSSGESSCVCQQWRIKLCVSAVEHQVVCVSSGESSCVCQQWSIKLCVSAVEHQVVCVSSGASSCVCQQWSIKLCVSAVEHQVVCVSSGVVPRSRILSFVVLVQVLGYCRLLVIGSSARILSFVGYWFKCSDTVVCWLLA